MKLQITIVCLLILNFSNSYADTERGLRNYQAIMNGSKSVDQLSLAEKKEVLEVINAGKRSSSNSRSSRNSYEVEFDHNDEVFIINGEKFEAKTYCFNLSKGDRVIFIEGSPFGACVSATVLNLRNNEKCELWCE